MKTSTCKDETLKNQPNQMGINDTTILSTIPASCAILPTMHTTKPSKSTLPYPYPLNEHGTRHCSLHSLPHKRQSISAKSSSNKISQPNLHYSNMLYDLALLMHSTVSTYFFNFFILLFFYENKFVQCTGHTRKQLYYS